ncbi:hypothetical protein QY97_02004 [Bacillus thermotolerans]|uniref:Uncharacterized protein n=1 Tax=Bacillus thermotolerans TaxID=1221996 RepID=A0A0F5HQ27_BACTR|nr:hypothetical protein QY97_02004 [Bacillus thermotolerans]KKB43376.1 hypothetical protein QY95_01621 [Bacillus thermotolerans]KKB43503.1 hypothetical protein QY96_00901 [Bacillus thermotolerans]
MIEGDERTNAYITDVEKELRYINGIIEQEGFRYYKIIRK